MLGLAPIPDRFPLQPYRLLAARLAEEALHPPLAIIDDAALRSDDPVLGDVVQAADERGDVGRTGIVRP